MFQSLRKKYKDNEPEILLSVMMGGLAALGIIMYRLNSENGEMALAVQRQGCLIGNMATAIEKGYKMSVDRENFVIDIEYPEVS